MFSHTTVPRYPDEYKAALYTHIVPYTLLILRPPVHWAALVQTEGPDTEPSLSLTLRGWARTWRPLQVSPVAGSVPQLQQPEGSAPPDLDQTSQSTAPFSAGPPSTRPRPSDPPPASGPAPVTPRAGDASRACAAVLARGAGETHSAGISSFPLQPTEVDPTARPHHSYVLPPGLELPWP